MADIDALRLELDALDKKRSDVESRIRGMRGARGHRQQQDHLGKRRAEDNDFGSKRRRGGDDDDEHDRQKPKPRIMSAVVAPGQDQAQERPDSVEAYKNPETVNRNRRMFGALMGHLGSASRRLKQDTALLQKREQVQKEVQHKVDEEATRLRELQRRIYQEEQEKDQRTRDELLAQQRRTEVLLAQAAFVGQQNAVKHFIPTTTQPSLLFLPSRHNDATSEMLANHAAEIEQKIKERQDIDNQKLEEIAQIVPDGVEARRIRREERQARYANGDQNEAGADQEDGENDDIEENAEAAQDNEEDLDALERELDTEDIGIETIDGKQSKPVERWQNKKDDDEKPVAEEKAAVEEEPPTRRRSARKRN